MDSVAQKKNVPSAPHTFVDGVEGKVCGAVRRVKTVPSCGKWKPMTEYWRSKDYEDEKNCLCVDCCKAWTASKRQEGTRGSKALTLSDARPVVFDDGTQASVGWYGDVEYFPITPLLGLTNYKTEHGLLDAIRNDPLMRELPRRFVVINSGAGAPSWHLPWSHFSTFILKYGSEQTRPQQERVQKVIEAAFGHTAASNREASERIDQGDTVVWEENRQQHSKTHKLIEQVRDDLRGATLYKDRVLVIRGAIYFKRLWPEISLEAVSQLIDIPNAAEMWRRGYRPYKIGQTGKKDAQTRTNQYRGEVRMKSSPPLAEIHVDNPEEAERILKRTKPRDAIPAEGCAEVFWAKPSIEERVRRSWAKHPTMAVADLAIRMQGWEIGVPVHVEQHSYL